MGFHVDTSGNIWSGTNVGDTFSSANPTFYVTDAGFLYSVSGEIGGISVSSTGIEGSFTSTTGFQINSAGDATFRDVTVRGTIEATNLTDNMTMNGGKIRTSSSGSRVEIFDSSNVGMINFIDADGSTLMSMQAGSDEFIMVGGTDDNVKITTVQGKEFRVAGGSIVLESDTSLKFDLGGPIYLGIDPGGAGEVLTSGGANAAPSWQTSSAHSHSGYTFPSSGTLLSSDNHSHGTPLTSNHENASNPHDNYLQEADHNANNTAHSNFLTSADLSSHITNNNNIYNSVVDHTDITANQGGGSAHGLSLSGVNAAVLHVNDNSAHTNHNHNYGLAEDPHGNGEHNEAYITNNNANAHHGNAYAAPHNGHAHSHNEYAGNHNHPYLNENHNNQVGHHTHNAGVATDPHGNGDHNASFITNSNANAHHGNTYANFSHLHPNPLTHDSRLLTVNANSVPGLNVVQRMNPVTANFSEQYKNKVLEEPSSLVELNQKTYRLTYQDVKQALEDDGVDTTDVAMIIENVEYANELAPELDDNMKGLMDGEIDAILVQAIKDLSAKIDLLEDRIATLEG